MSYSTKFLNKTITVKIDRPLGSIHPKHNNIYYSLNYGYIPDTMAPDGEELDAYLLGVYEPVEEFEGKCIAVIHRKNDDDDKLVVVPVNKDTGHPIRSYSSDAILALTEFQERFFEVEIIR